MARVETALVNAIDWGDDAVALPDQMRLPDEEVWLRLADGGSVVEAIREMRVRVAVDPFGPELRNLVEATDS